MQAQQSIDKQATLRAAEERVKALGKKAPTRVLYMPFDEEHEKRQAFRERVDRIIEANRPAQAIESLKVVLKLAHNILQNPEEDKYRRFKITNDQIMRTVMLPKGVSDLVMDLGFREKVKWQNAEEYCSYYIYSAKTCNSLRIGSAIIEEILEGQDKTPDAQCRQREEGEQKELIEKLRMQILDDRKSVAARVQRERESAVREKGLPRRKAAPMKANIVTINGCRPT